MKNAKMFLTLIPVSLVLSACGGEWKKDPVSGNNGTSLEEIRKYSKEQIANAPKGPHKELVPVINTKVETVYVEQATVDDKTILIAPDQQMDFNEGQTGTYKIRATSLVEGRSEEHTSELQSH